jgi:folate-binding protein YgfZ
MSTRTVLAVSGTDRVAFLQGLVTNDVEKAKDGLVYTALLTAQGKFLVDFFMLQDGERILIDVDTDHAPALFKRLNMYRLRADVAVAETDITVSRGTGSAPDGSYTDPRHPDLGWRDYTGATGDDTDWDALRIALKIPEMGQELIPDASYILEMDFERLNGVDFRKGCYVGQEIVARMKHKTELRKGLAQVTVTGNPDNEITSDGKPVGQLFTVSNGKALAYLRFDRAKGEMQAGEATVTLT